MRNSKNMKLRDNEHNVFEDAAEMYKISYKFDEKNSIFWIYCDIDNNLELRFSTDLYDMMKKVKTKKKTFLINLSSSGGMVDSTLSMYDMMEKSGFIFDCHVPGACYSMASFLLSACNGERTMGRYAKYGQHGAFTFFDDEKVTKETLQSEMEVFNIDKNIMDKILIKRSDGALSQEKLDYIDKLEMKYFTAEQALDYGLIDKVI